MTSRFSIMQPLRKFAAVFFLALFGLSSCKKEKISPSRSPIMTNRPDSIPAINTHVIKTQLIWVGNLSQWRLGTAAAAAGNKILFAGGISVDYNSDINGIFSRVDIYDIITQVWTTAELSQARYNIAAVGAGNKIFFAGGMTATGATSTRVDIYDVATNSWSTAELGEARENIAAASSGNKILFAGGESPGPAGVSSRIDIYDVSSNTWSTATLSERRAGIAAGSAGTKILFAGGWNANSKSNRVDIYDAATNTWSTTALSEAREVTGVTTVGNTIIFASAFGATSSSSYSDRVDMYDAATGNWSIDSLNRYDSLGHGYGVNFSGAATSGNFAFFFPSSGIRNFIIYDAGQRTWAISSAVLPFGWEAAFVTAHNEIYIAGWEGVWRVQF